MEILESAAGNVKITVQARIEYKGLEYLLDMLVVEDTYNTYRDITNLSVISENGWLLAHKEREEIREFLIQNLELSN